MDLFAPFFFFCSLEGIWLCEGKNDGMEGERKRAPGKNKLLIYPYQEKIKTLVKHCNIFISSSI